MNNVLHVTFAPQTEKEKPGETWKAWYPGLDWTVTGTSKADAIEKLIAELKRRSEDPVLIDEQFRIAQRALYEPIDGVESEVLSEDEVEYPEL